MIISFTPFAIKTINLEIFIFTHFINFNYLPLSRFYHHILNNYIFSQFDYPTLLSNPTLLFPLQMNMQVNDIGDIVKPMPLSNKALIMYYFITDLFQHSMPKGYLHNQVILYEMYRIQGVLLLTAPISQ